MKKKLNTILLVDDDEPTNYLNKMILEEVDCAEKIEVAQSAKEAINYLMGAGKYNQKGKTIPPPELIFLDINMPAMDGWEFIDIYKELKKRGNVVMVMLTTSLNPEDEERSKMMAEVSGYRNKPLTKEMVTEILENHFKNDINGN